MFIHEKSITLHIGHQNSSLWENISILLLTGDSSDWYFHFLKRRWMNVIHNKTR